jgi:hypothetical protein
VIVKFPNEFTGLCSRRLMKGETATADEIKEFCKGKVRSEEELLKTRCSNRLS